jgi:hypothetical protein
MQTARLSRRGRVHAQPQDWTYPSVAIAATLLAAFVLPVKPASHSFRLLLADFFHRDFIFEVVRIERIDSSF